MLVRMPPPPPSRRLERICTGGAAAGAGSGGPRMLLRILVLADCVVACLAGCGAIAGSIGVVCFKADFFFFGLLAREFTAGLYSSSDER
jgi:hypothetical protein